MHKTANKQNSVYNRLLNRSLTKSEQDKTRHKMQCKNASAIIAGAILIFIITAASSGCLPQPSSENEFIGKFAGVDFEIRNPLPGSRVFTGNRFAPSIRVRGNGEGTLCITGLDRETFRGFNECECQIFSISEDEGYNDISFGGYEVQNFPGSKSLTAIVKYKSTAEAKTNLILKHEAVEEDLPVLSRTFGAVMIKNIEESLQPSGQEGRVSITLTITMEDTGEGQVYDAGKVRMQNCMLEESNGRLRIKIKGIPFIGEVECETSPFENNEATAVCHLGEINLISKGQSIAEGNYMPEITIQAEYGYSEAKTHTFNVES